MALDSDTETALSRMSNVLVEMTSILENLSSDDEEDNINVNKINDRIEMLENSDIPKLLDTRHNNSVYGNELKCNEPTITVANKKKISPRVSTALSQYSSHTQMDPDRNVAIADSSLGTSPPLAYMEALNECLHNCLLVAGRGEMNRFVIHMYLKRHGTWSTSQHIPLCPLPRRCFVFCQSWVYFIGGEEKLDLKLDKLYTYNICTGALSLGPSLRVSRCDASAIFWKNNIYVAGGLNRLNIAMTHVEIYDTYLNTWQLMQPMKYKRHRSGITIVKGVLYLIGGYTLRCECYNIDQPHGWLGLPDLPDCSCEDFSMFATHNDGHVMAIRDFRPDRVFMLNLNDTVWKVMRTVGIPPENVQDTCKCFEELYAIDITGKIFVLNLKIFTWDQTINCPKSLSNVFHIATITFADIRNSHDKVIRDFE